jgi:hypothetical protein
MKKTTKIETVETYEWLMMPVRRKCAGMVLKPRIQTLSWEHLGRIYRRGGQDATKIREAIRAEAHRCGYKPETILTLNR